MNWDAISAISELVAAIGVMATLIYLAVQIRISTKLASAQSRHALSEFILPIAIFRAEHADRLARIENGSDLTDGDRLFRYWSHVQMLLHAETYFHHHELGLMPESHWRGYARFVAGYTTSQGFAEVWAEVGASFSEDFVRWVDTLVTQLPSGKPGAA